MSSAYVNNWGGAGGTESCVSVQTEPEPDWNVGPTSGSSEHHTNASDTQDELYQEVPRRRVRWMQHPQHGVRGRATRRHTKDGPSSGSSGLHPKASDTCDEGPSSLSSGDHTDASDTQDEVADTEMRIGRELQQPSLAEAKKEETQQFVPIHVADTEMRIGRELQQPSLAEAKKEETQQFVPIHVADTEMRIGRELQRPSLAEAKKEETQQFVPIHGPTSGSSGLHPKASDTCDELHQEVPRRRVRWMQHPQHGVRSRATRRHTKAGRYFWLALLLLAPLLLGAQIWVSLQNHWKTQSIMMEEQKRKEFWMDLAKMVFKLTLKYLFGGG